MNHATFTDWRKVKLADKDDPSVQAVSQTKSGLSRGTFNSHSSKEAAAYGTNQSGQTDVSR